MNIASYQLLLLDVMMGEISGFKLASILKNSKTTSSIPIIFCTAKDTEKDTVEGLNLGADDYISKPFSVKEVIARVKAVLRRIKQEQQKQNPSKIISYEDLVIDSDSKKASIKGQTLALTKKEFELLLLFVSHPNVVFNRESLLEKIWHDDVYVIDRTIDVHITRLRKKIVPYDKQLVTRLATVIVLKYKRIAMSSGEKIYI
jgi:DNA-binding response OmpR family regulator